MAEGLMLPHYLDMYLNVTITSKRDTLTSFLSTARRIHNYPTLLSITRSANCRDIVHLAHAYVDGGPLMPASRLFSPRLVKVLIRASGRKSTQETQPEGERKRIEALTK
jgi:hypothetical protein